MIDLPASLPLAEWAEIGLAMLVLSLLALVPAAVLSKDVRKGRSDPGYRPAPGPDTRPPGPRD